MPEKLTYDALLEKVRQLEASRKKSQRAEKEYVMILEVLQLVNESKTRDELLRNIILRIKAWSGCEAVGIRIQEGEDFPYFTTEGFPEDFVKQERYLCHYGDDGEPRRDREGIPILECMCGNILRGRFDPSKNFFTEDGCFWSNCTTRLLATTTDADRQARTRNRCNGEGYESVALIPIRSAGETFGLIQLNDHRENRFSTESMALYRRIADHIASFLAGIQADEERQKLHGQLIQAQKMESVGRLAGGVAHDLNNLLTPIIGYSEMLMEDLSPHDDRRRDMNEVLKAGNRARDLVHQLLAFSRKQTLEFQAVNLNEVVKNFKGLLRRTIPEDVKIRIMPAPRLLPVMADIGQIEQVIMNLAVNGSDAMPEGGVLTMETAMAELGENYGRTHAEVSPGMYVMLAVSDTGYGMDEEIQRQIFEPFFSTKGKEGTGLGLATVYGIVKQHRGNIWVYSEPGRGTSFKVYLPVTEAAGSKEAPQMPAAEALGGKETLLLVEDNEQVLILAETILKRQGYTVLTARSGDEAEEKALSLGGPLHLLLTDVVMPGMNGRKLYERLAPQFPQLKVLYMSGYTDNTIAHRGVLEEGIRFIQKPFSNRTLSAKVREVLDRP